MKTNTLPRVSLLQRATPNIGTRSILFGVHQFMIHPWFVALGWWKLYGFPFDPRLWVAFFVHDLGYWGKPNMDGPEGENHVWLGAYIMRWLFDWPRIVRVPLPRGGYKREPNYRWLHFTAFHSRFMARQLHQQPSRLCFADKMAIALEPQWFYLLRARLSGELEEYMKGSGARTPCKVGAHVRSPRQWLTDVQRYTRDYCMTHKDGAVDTWTGTARDLALHLHENKQ